MASKQLRVATAGVLAAAIRVEDQAAVGQAQLPCHLQRAARKCCVDRRPHRPAHDAAAEQIDAELACGALEMAWQQRMPGSGLIFHSDRGSQYASGRYTELLRGHGIRASMSRKSNCWDNACSETLFGSLKVERLHGEKFKTHREGKDEILNWVLWYNKSRMHSTLGYQSPAQFERQAHAQHAIAA